MFEYTEDPTNEIAHRPWPLPDGPWIMAQRWNNLLFAHWPVKTDVVRTLVPRTLTLDTHDGTAWISITPFYLSHLRPRGIPSFPAISEFPELNVRTYVTLGGKAGVFFFSLDAGSTLVVEGARALYHLPYYRADMTIAQTSDGLFRYDSKRTHPGAPPAEFSAQYKPSGEVSISAPDSLDHWLTERYRLYAAGSRNTLYYADIHHRPWPLQPAEADFARNSMAAAAMISLPNIPPRMSFARTLDVVVWAPAQIKT